MNSERRDALALVLSWALFWAMMAALMHVGFVSVKYIGLGKFAGAERGFVWMVPLSYALTFSVLAIPALLLAVSVPRPACLRLIVSVFGFAGVLAILLLFPRLHPTASVILAAGVAVRASSWAKHFSASARRAALIVAAGLVTIGAVNGLERRFNEWLTFRSLPLASDGSPNVLLIILDTVRAANMNFLGYHRETAPELSTLGSRGAIFEQAYSTAPWTLPSHAAFFTGRYGSHLSADWEVPLNESEATVAEVFRDHGYATAGFVANRFYAAWDSGLDRGFVHYDDSRISAKQVMLTTTFSQTNVMRSIARGRSIGSVLRSLRKMDLGSEPLPSKDLKPAGRVTADFLRWLPSSRGRPFFAFINLFDAHLPYTSPWPRRFSRHPGQSGRYDAAIFYMDSVVGALFDSLEVEGVLANTIVVVTSDHGEGLGEHGLNGHAWSLYRTELHVPLVISFPGAVPVGVRISKPVSLRDLPATLLELAGIVDEFPGVSLQRAWTAGGAPGSDVISEITRRIRTGPNAPASRGDMRSAIDDSTHFILNGDGVEELYAWRADPDEQRNLANLLPFRQTAAGMRARIDRMLGAK